MNLYRMSRDKNGNKTVKIIPPMARGFSIQTNGNLPQTHSGGYSSTYTPGEVREYVGKYGTERQKHIMAD